MKLKITSKKVFEVHSGSISLGDFCVVSQWNGMTELVNAAGHHLILGQPSALDVAFDGILKEGVDVEIVKVAPSLYAQILKGQEAK